MGYQSVDVGDNDAVLFLREDDSEAGLSIEVAFEMNENMCRTKLLALALSWACQDEDWRSRMILRAKKKVMKIVEDAGHEYE